MAHVAQILANARLLLLEAFELLLLLGREDERGLVATIITAMTPAAAFQTLQQFDDEWWLDAAYGSQMQLSIDLEFRHR